MAATVPLPRPDGSSGAPPHLGPGWRRSSYSQGTDATCVEAAVDGDAVALRDSNDPTGPVLRFSFAEWEVFLLGVRAGEFELPVHGPPSLSAGGPQGTDTGRTRCADALAALLTGSSASRAASSSRDRTGSAATRQASARASE
jgi:Domain of unknown function (DUF397)